MGAGAVGLALVQRSPKRTVIFENLSHRIGRKKGIIAAARRLLTVAVTLLKKQEPYRELFGSTALGTADQNERTPSRPARRQRVK